MSPWQNFSADDEGIWVVAAASPKQEAQERLFADAFIEAAEQLQQTTGTLQPYIGLEALIWQINVILQRAGKQQRASWVPATLARGLAPFIPNIGEPLAAQQAGRDGRPVSRCAVGDQGPGRVEFAHAAAQLHQGHVDASPDVALRPLCRSPHVENRQPGNLSEGGRQLVRADPASHLGDRHRCWSWVQLAQIGPSQGKLLSWALRLSEYPNAR